MSQQGYLKDAAMDMIKIGNATITRSPEEEKERTWQGYLLAMKEARELGVTSIQNAGGADFKAYERLQKEGLLTSRIDIGAPLTGDTLPFCYSIRRRRKNIRRTATGSGSVTSRLSLMAQ